MWESPYFTGILRTPVRLSARWTPVRWVDLKKKSMFMFMFVSLFWCRELSYSMTSTCSNPSRLCCPGSKPIHKACCNKKGHFYVFCGNFKFWIEIFLILFSEKCHFDQKCWPKYFRFGRTPREFSCKELFRKELKTFLAGVPPKVFGQLHSPQCTLKTQNYLPTLTHCGIHNICSSCDWHK